MTTPDALFSRIPTTDHMGDLVDTLFDRVPITRIHPNPDQPRRSIDEASPQFKDLVGSIREQGLIQPISLWQESDQADYIIEAGERRWRAFRALAIERPADFSRIPAMVRRLVAGDPATTLLARALVENVVRDELSPGDTGAAILRLRTITGATWEKLADRLGLSLRTVRRLATIAGNDIVREAVDAGTLTQHQGAAVARALPSDNPELAAARVDRVSVLPPAAAHAAVIDAMRSGRGAHGSNTPPSLGPTLTDHDEIDLMSTPLAIIRPRVARLGRRAYTKLIRELRADV